LTMLFLQALRDHATLRIAGIAVGRHSHSARVKTRPKSPPRSPANSRAHCSTHVVICRATSRIMRDF
jgi:hypothetical protein